MVGCGGTGNERLTRENRGKTPADDQRTRATGQNGQIPGQEPVRKQTECAYFGIDQRRAVAESQLEA